MATKKWLVFGISGATCTGKTTLATRLHKELKNSVIISQDDYFLPIDDPRQVKLEELNHYNWEVIESIDTERMYSDITKIIEDSPNENNCKITANRNIVILEGFILFKSKLISDLCDLKFFITITKELCKGRRQNRVYEPPDVPGYFEKAVWPEYLKHTDELIKDENLSKTITFIDGTKSKDEIYQMVLTEIKKFVS